MVSHPRQPRPPRLLQLLAAVLCLSFGHASVWAADARTEETERAEAKVIEAKAFFKSALFAEAAESYLQAFAISHKPATLFNAARAYEEAKVFAKAIALFEQYVQLADTPPDGRREANERIAHDHAALAAAAAAHAEPAPAVVEDKPAPAKPAEPAPAAEVKVAGEPATKSAETEEPKPAAPAPVKSNWLDWALFAGGDTLVVLGLLGWAGAVNNVNQANAMDFSAANAEADYNAKVASARNARSGAVVIAVVGAGLAGWGAWRLWGPGNSTKQETVDKSTSWLLPTVAADGAGVAWGGRF